jgi:hypothetical protein
VGRDMLENIPITNAIFMKVKSLYKIICKRVKIRVLHNGCFCIQRTIEL